MAKLIPNTWVSTDAYSVGDTAYYNGSVYECTVAVAANANGNAIPVGNSSWTFDYLVRIEDYYSLQDAVEEALNVDDDVINNSIPFFIQTAEFGVNKTLRSPAQKVVRTFPVDSEGRINIPSDILQILNMRTTLGDTSNTLEGRGSISIESAIDKQQFDAIRLSDSAQIRGFPSASQAQYPVYWNDDEHFWIAPKYPEGTEIELTYFQNVPSLGTLVLRVNDDYEALNADNETLAEWVADGNAATDFVQAEDLVTQNLWTVSIPHLLKLGALVAAEQYLKNDERIGVWREAYNQNFAETQNEFHGFESLRQQSQVMVSSYFSDYL